MPLYVTRHQHAEEGCPAGDLQMGPMLLQHVSKDSASRAGINIHGEAVVQEHTFYMIVEASDIDKVQEFMSPFAQVGSTSSHRTVSAPSARAAPSRWLPHGRCKATRR